MEKAKIKAYFDESGNTGCVLLSQNGMLNFKNQPIFVLGSVIVKEGADEARLIEKYKNFKDKFNITGEIKGSDLMTRKNNELLEYFVENILDDVHYRVNIYDKRFYLATLLVAGLCGMEFQNNYKKNFYCLATALTRQDDDFFEEYCKYITNPTKEKFTDYLKFLRGYEYKYINSENNELLLFADCILSSNREEYFYDAFLTFGSYDNKKLTNVINLTALGELLSHLKLNNTITNRELVLVHDNIDQFQETMKKELQFCGLNISFEDSEKSELLQAADNVASVVSHSFLKVKQSFNKNAEWSKSDEWHMKLYAELLSKITPDHIKFTIPISDWTLSLCMQEMFSKDFSAQERNIASLKPLYITNQNRILNALSNPSINTRLFYRALER